jgi:hypothetical protein
MRFNPMGFMLASLMTRDLADRNLAARISLLGGMLGGNATGAVLLAAVASQERDGTVPGLPPGRDGGAAAPRSVEVPEMHDDPEASERVVRVRGLVPAIQRVESDEPVDVVMACRPEPGTVVARGSTVTILVSAGLRVPDVTGQDADEAEALLKAVGFADVAREQSEKSGREDVVDRQEPEAGTLEDSRTTVTLFVFGRKRALEAAEP